MCGNTEVWTWNKEQCAKKTAKLDTTGQKRKCPKRRIPQMVKLLFGEKTLENCLRGCNGKMATITQSVLCIEDACLVLCFSRREKNNCLTRKQKRKAVSDPLPWPRPSQCAQHPHTLTFFLKPNKIYHQYMRVCCNWSVCLEKKLLSLCKIYSVIYAEAGCALKIVSWWPMDNSMKQKKFPLLPFPTFFLCVSP